LGQLGKDAQEVSEVADGFDAAQAGAGEQSSGLAWWIVICDVVFRLLCLPEHKESSYLRMTSVETEPVGSKRQGNQRDYDGAPGDEPSPDTTRRRTHLLSDQSQNWQSLYHASHRQLASVVSVA